MPKQLSFEYVLTPQGLERGRRLRIDEKGRIEAIEVVEKPGVQDGGLALPGMPNAHSHSFQRALLGAGESASAASFWSWRESMYRVANELDPHSLHVIARRVFKEMLEAGFTSVGEFHYLHHMPQSACAPDRSDLSSAFAMADALRRAASETHIRLTMLPVLYQRSGFGQPAKAEQKSFVFDSLDDFGRLLEHLSDGACGVAAHSVRAVPLEALPRLVEMANEILGQGSPIHIHVSEQSREVEECRARTGCTPIQCLADTVELSGRWSLIHATHATPAELQLLEAQRPNLVLCPLTEAYLGDGIFPLARFVERGGQFAIGTDSNVRIDAAEELRFAEYVQRLCLQRREVLAGTAGLGPTVWRNAAQAGAQSLAQPVGAIEIGKYADIVVLDLQQPLFADLPVMQVIDAWILGGDGRQIASVYVGGEKVL